MVRLIKLIQLYTLRVSLFNFYCIQKVNEYILVMILPGRDILPAWDRQIQSLCYQVNNIMEKIAAVAPEWMNKAMDEQMVH